MGCTCPSYSSQSSCLPPTRQHLLPRGRSKGCGCQWPDLTYPGSGMSRIAFGTSVDHSPCPRSPVGGQEGLLVLGSLPLVPGGSGWSSLLQARVTQDLRRQHPTTTTAIHHSASPAASEGLRDTKATGTASPPSPCQGQDSRDTQSEGTGPCFQDLLTDILGESVYVHSSICQPPGTPTPLLNLDPCSVLARFPS